MALPIGKTIKDRYQIVRVISNQGGFGTTYLAHDLFRGQDIVIKESKTASDVEQEALLGELQILQALDHPRLPRVYEGFFHERQLCVTMQYIQGRDVSSYLVMAEKDRRAEPPDRPTALRWIVQTLEALAYLHSRSVIHRDVKPSNLRVSTETGNIFLLDFGISHHAERSLIRAHSPRFSPPEQHDPSGTTTPASDVYAVGATLYLLLTGREPPYRDDHNDKTIRLPTEESQTIPRELEEIVIRAMCYNAAERYPNAQAMLEEFQRLGYASRPPAEARPREDRAPALAPVAPEQPALAGEAHTAAAAPEDQSLRTMATVTLPNLDEEPQPLAQTSPADLPINGLIKGRYTIREVISKRGGFGLTYWATDIRRGRDVLLKLSKTVEAETFDSLLAEHELLSKLKHQRLPRVYETFSYKHEDKVLLGISMQYIRGRDVSSYLQDGPPDRPRALQWARQLLEALAYLHKQEIVHCDVKPSNLRIDDETGDLFLLDFGISQQKNELTVRGFSPHYSAPEQRLRNSKIEPSADVYAAGAILHALLTGYPPPERTAQTEPLSLLDSERLAIPDELKRITRKALRPDSSERYPDAQAMLKELKRIPYGRNGTTSPLLWGAVGIGVVSLLVMVASVSMLAWNRVRPPAAVGENVATTAAITSPEATSAPVSSAAPSEVASSATPSLARTVIAADAAVLLVPTTRAPVPTAFVSPTTAVQSYQVRQIEVAGQTDSAAINVRELPVKLALVGEGLDGVTSVMLQPRTPGQRAIPLTLLQARPDRVELELAALPPGFRIGEYELLVNDQVDRAVTLRDYARAARLQGVKAQYSYLAGIRPFPGISFEGRQISGPFAVLYQQPEQSSRGSYLQNGDLVEILDDTATPGLYLVRVRENFDPTVIGREGWVLAWIVEGTPPPPPAPGAIQMPYNIRGEKREQVMEWLRQRGVADQRILVDVQTRERIPEVFDSFQPDQVVSSVPPEGEWIMPEGQVTLGVRGP